MKELFLLRSIPGAGKSTLAKSLVTDQHGRRIPEFGHYETDDYFFDENGYYNFNSRLIGHAHEWNKKQVKKHMQGAQKKTNDRIVVANTFTKESEMQPYYDLANNYGYIVFSLIVENRHEGVNVHGVPEEAIEKMHNRFEIKLKP
jgi:predicted kinase